MYQLLSLAERNGWVSTGLPQVEVSPHAMPLVLIVAAIAGPAAREATMVVRMPHRLIKRERRLSRNCFISVHTFRGEHWQPSYLARVRDLWLCVPGSRRVCPSQ